MAFTYEWIHYLTHTAYRPRTEFYRQAKLMKLDDWNDVVIRVQGNRIQHFYNGRLTLDFTDKPLPRNPSGKLLKNVLRGKGAVPFDTSLLE